MVGARCCAFALNAMFLASPTREPYVLTGITYQVGYFLFVGLY